MAKKSKNLVQVVCDLLTVVLGGLLLGFVALPHVRLEYKTNFTGTLVSETSSGYSLISFEEGANVGLSVVLLLAIIFAGLMVLSGLLKLACDTGVVKGGVFAKVVKLVMVVSALATVALFVTNIFTVSGACQNGGLDFIISASGGTYPVLATLIVNACLGGVAFLSSLVSLKK